MQLNKEIIKSWNETKEKIYEKIFEVTKKSIDFGELEKLSSSARWGIENWEIENDQIYVSIGESWPYGGYDSHSLVFPINYLFEDYENELLENKNRREEQKRKSEEEKKLKEQEKERETYLKLKEKFEDHE